jgi:hypothetical protein
MIDPVDYTAAKRADYSINRQTLMVGFYFFSTNLENSFVSPSVPWQNPSIGGENAAWFRENHHEFL